MFTLAEWLASGHTLSESVSTTEHTFPQSEFTNSCVGVGGQPWQVANAENVPASMTVLDATTESINTAFGAMGKQLDLCKIAELAKSMGIHRADGAELGQTPSSILGVNELSPIDLAEAYAGFANGGVVCTPTAIDSVTTADGTKITPTPADCTQGVSAEVAGTVDYALQGVLSGNGTAASANPGDSTPKFAKTGTTDGDVQNWLVASSTKYTNATWIGNVQGNVRLANWPFLQGTTGYSAKFGVGKSMMGYLDQHVGRRRAAGAGPGHGRDTGAREGRARGRRCCCDRRCRCWYGRRCRPGGAGSRCRCARAGAAPAPGSAAAAVAGAVAGAGSGH